VKRAEEGKVLYLKTAFLSSVQSGFSVIGKASASIGFNGLKAISY
jgi:hypothetical protein